MTQRDLAALEREANALPDPKDRAEALAALEDLRRLRSNIEGMRLPDAPALPRPRPFANVHVGRLVAGSVASITLLLGARFAVVPAAQWAAGDRSPGNIAWALMGTTVVALAAVVLYFAVRSPAALAAPADAETASIMRRFGRRTLLANIATVAWAVLVTIALVAWPKSAGYTKVAAAAFTAALIGGYWLLYRVFVRCPSCEAPQRPSRRFSSGGSRDCPRCGCTLQ